jgi:D-sedoheptulose 7-phosphate isomerase
LHARQWHGVIRAVSQPYYAFFDEIRLRLDDASDDDLHSLCALITAAMPQRAFIIGNGGSAGIASHVAVDFTKVLGLATNTFTDPALITCFANDYGYENAFAEAIKANADLGDLVILISSSGKSPNIVNAARAARTNGCRIVTLSGFDPNNPLRQLGDVNLYCRSSTYNVVEAVHLIWLLAAVERLANG